MPRRKTKSERNHISKHWERGKFIAQNMMDLPERYRFTLPLSDDFGMLQEAARAIRAKYTADRAAEIADAPASQTGRAVATANQAESPEGVRQ